MLLFITNLVLVFKDGGLVYQAIFVPQIALLIFSITGYTLIQIKQNTSVPSLFNLPFYFAMVHVAAFLGLVDELKGIKYITWDHVREVKAD